MRENVDSLKGSGAGLAVAILGTLYACLGAAGATQDAFNRVWAVPRNERASPITQACAACPCCSCSVSAWLSRRRCPDCRLTVSDVSTRQLRIGAVGAGIGWQVVQILGTYFVAHMLTGAPQAYGVFGLVLGLIAWIYLLALVVVLAAEVNVVSQRRLWPRALLTPFTDRVRLTSADERAYTAYAESERHKGFEVVDVGFERPEEEAGANDGGESGEQ